MGKVTLTFDNGPEPDVTPAVLDCLNRHGVKATFFVLGRKVSLPVGLAISKRASEEGHWIGNHTFTHEKPLGELDRATALREFEQAEQALAWLRQPQRLFRPHGGGMVGPHLLHPAVVEKLQAGGYSCVLWNCVPGDWRDADGWLKRALADCRSRDWSLVVLHDLSNQAMAHLDQFISALKAEGFELRQDYPPECVPIAAGRLVLPIEQLLPAATEKFR
jgi:peptidoglycan/xylan/chitin deacetylase (PgdA/CDA1 family)